MRSPLDRARGRLERFRKAEAELWLARLAGEDDAAAARDATRARAALGTGENRADLEDARSDGLLSPESEALLLPHLADVAAAEAVARAGASLFVRGSAPVIFEAREETLAGLLGEALRGPSARTVPRLRAVAGVVDRERGARREALAAAEEASARVLARGPASPDRAPDDLAARSSTFLAATDEVTHELAGRLRHARGLRAEEETTALVLGLAGASGPSLWRGAEHGPAVTALLRPLALDGPLARGVALARHGLVTLEAPVVARAGSAAIVHAGSIDVCLASRLLVVESAVRALSLSLVSAAAPFEVRAPAAGSSLARALGVTFASALGEPEVLVRSLGLDRREAEIEAIAATLVLLLVGRLRATRSLSLRDAPGEEEARLRASRALALREPVVSPEAGHSSMQTRAELDAATRASLAGLAATAALKERFDVDWARNPRVEHVLRAASHHGAALSAERWLAELGGRPDDAGAFGRERAGG